MRTTIELTDQHRSALVEMAARRGEKGFSGLVGEALDLYFADQKQTLAERRRKAASSLRGALGPDGAEALRERVAELRSQWR